MKNKTTFDKEKRVENTEIPPTKISIYNYWLLSILAMITTSMFRSGTAMEVIYHDKVYDINFFSISMTCILICAGYAAIYYSQRSKALTPWMTNLHTIITLGIIGTVFLTSFREQSWDISEVVPFTLITFIIAQCVLVWNIAKNSK